MKKLVLFSSLALMIGISTAQEKSGGFKEGFKMMTESVGSSVKEGWDVTKEKTSELSKDAKEGLDKAGDSIMNKIDDMQKSYEVSDADSLHKYLTVSNVKINALDNNRYSVSAILKNITKKPVTFNRKMKKLEVIALDADGIAHFATKESLQESRELVVPADSGIKMQWIFDDVDSGLTIFRLFDVNFSLEN
ncbi:hypothetical protein [Wohlfahrtiimonas larvae]|uniref:DUF4352 domain-containing protein n=1 Tax=Wohlfahrtiimonas larvae TaxID=1157986 RepID=A0ABP9MHB7_9GAMM|nr:hypothetical protein [Wohlfahrtiimonas larvae]